MQQGQAFILVIVGILILGIVAGGAYYFGKSQTTKPQQQNAVITSQTSQLTPAPSPSPVDETANWKTYTNATYGYSIKYPPEYKLKADKVNTWEKFYIPKMMDNQEDFQEEVMISRQRTSETDVCSKKLDGYPDAKCIKINNINFLDWKSDIANVYGPINFNYSVISNGTLFQITFLGIDKNKKDQILYTFKITR